MNRITLYKYIQNYKDDAYFLQVIYYLMRKSLIESNFVSRKNLCIKINEKFMPESMLVEMGIMPNHSLDGLTLLLFIRAIMIDKSYLGMCMEGAPIFGKKLPTAYDWIDWYDIINECKSDKEFEEIYDCVRSMRRYGKLPESLIQKFKIKTIEPPYRYLKNYYRKMANSLEECEEVIKSNAHVCDDSLQDIVVNQSVGYVGDTAFSYCNNLTSIVFLNPKVMFGHFPIVECKNLRYISVPSESIDYYKNELPYYSDIIISIQEFKEKKDNPEENKKPTNEEEPPVEEALHNENLHIDEEKNTEENNKVKINYNLIYEVFRNVSTSYKYLWLLSLLSIIKRKGHKTIPLSEMVAEMMSFAWPLIHEYGLSLGKTDGFKAIAKNVMKVANLYEQSSANLVRQYIASHYDVVKKAVSPLLENVPYRFLSPWIPFVSASDVILKSNDRRYSSLYGLVDDNIILDEDWFDYIQENHEKLMKFAKDSLMEYLKKYNTEMALLKYKVNYK